MDDSKERPTGQIGRKPQPQSYSSLDKNSVRYSSSTASFGSPSPAKRDWPNPDSASKDRNEVPGSRRTEERARSRITYHEFMVLDQARSANIRCDNTRERNLVTIKRLHSVRKGSMRKIQPFTSEHVVSIRDKHFENDDLVIIYERIDVSLRHVTSILQDPFKPSQIAAICKQVSKPRHPHAARAHRK